MRKLLILLGIALISVFFIQVDTSYAEVETIGYISLTNVFQGYKKVEESNAKLDERKKAVQEQLTGMQDMQKNYDSLSDQGKKDMKKQLMEKQDVIRQETLEVRKDEDRVLREILQDIENVSEEFRKSKKLTFILDDRLIIAGPDSMDLTEEITKLLNERYK